MAGDWIKMRKALFEHPKVFRIADQLGKDELFVVGALLAFWGWAHDHAVDGRVDGATSRLVDKVTRVDGLADALREVGWIEFDASGAHIPRFEVHNSDSAKDRSMKSERQARWREKRKANPVDATPSTNASTREEKRREEVNTPPTPKGEIASASLAPVKQADPEGFLFFWDLWPKNDRKAARGKCLDAWNRHKCERVAAQILGHVRSLIGSDQWRDQGGKFIPAPLVYLNGQRWDGAEPASGSSDYWAGAGFPNRWEAESAGCFARNASHFRDGKKAVAA